jgi:uncharacterized membrane protein
MDSENVENLPVEKKSGDWSRKSFKNEAKVLLKGNWKVPVLSSLIIMAISFVFIGIFYPWEFIFNPYVVGNAFFYIRLFLYCIACFTLFPIIMYVTIYFHNQIKLNKENTTFTTFYSGFKYWKKGILGFLWQYLCFFLWMILFIVFAGILVAFLLLISEILGKINTQAGKISSLFAPIIPLIVYFFVFKKYYSYSLQMYLLADNPNLGVKKALTISKLITNSYKWKLFVLDLSFIGWYLLGMLSLGIGFLWITPYWSITRINAYHFIKTDALAKGIIKPEDFSVNPDKVSDN